MNRKKIKLIFQFKKKDKKYLFKDLMFNKDKI